MSSKEKYKQSGHTQIVQNRSGSNNKTNNSNSYSYQKIVVQKSIKTSYNTNETNYNQRSMNNQNKSTEYKIQSKIPVNKNQTHNKNIYQSKDVRLYEYTSGNTYNINSNLKHHPNQVNNLIPNHRFYNSITTKTEKATKTYQSGSRRSERVQSSSPIGRNKYIVETKKVELFSKPRYSSVSNSSRETNISISKTQLKKFIKNIWLEEIYCSNVETLCCLVDNQNNNRNSSAAMYEKELEQKAIIIKDYEAQILKLKSVLNIKEQEIKKLVQNLKQSESAIKNKKIYELNIKNKNVENLDKDAHELQIISTKQERKTNEHLDKDAHSLEIISFKKGWNGIIIPSPVNEIYIQTLMNSESNAEMREMNLIKEEEIIRRKKLEKISNLEIQEMGILSIISRRPKSNILCQHLESIMILSKENIPPLKFQKIQEINVTSEETKPQNEIQELNGLEIITYQKNRKVNLQEQHLNGLEIQRDYDMLLVKPLWNSLKIQGTGLNLLAMPRDIELENQEIDEFEIHGTKPEKIQVLMPVAENNMEKITNFEIIGKVKMKTDYKINKERIKLEGIPKKEEVNWNDINMPIKTTKLILKRNYEKLEQKIEPEIEQKVDQKIDIKWNELVQPIRSTKLIIKGNAKIEEPKKENIKMEEPKKENFKMEEFQIESFNINLIESKKEIKKSPLLINKEDFIIKGKEPKKLSLIKNKLDSINIFGLKKKNILIPSSAQNLSLTSEEVDINSNWNDHNKVMKTRELNIPKKIKEVYEMSKKVVNIEINSEKKIILKPMKAHKLTIKGKIKELIKKSSFKQIKENKLFIRSMKKKEEQKPEIVLKQINENKIFIEGIKQEIEKPVAQIINWNDLIKIQKNPIINLTHIPQKVIFKKQNLYTFSFKGIAQIPKEQSEKIVVNNNQSKTLMAQRNAKFCIKGRTKPMMKLLIIKGDKFMIQREPEDEIIFNDDYNELNQTKKSNGKEKSDNEKQEKIVVIKEKEITPIIQREIRAQVIRVKEETSESSSQSDVDVLAGIKKKGLLAFASFKDNDKSGYYKKIINGEVIFTPKSNLGVNLGAAKYQKQTITKKEIIVNKREQGRVSGLEISGNNGEVHYEKIGGISGAIKEGNYKIMNGCETGLNTKKFLNSQNKSTVNIRKSNRNSKVPNDSKKKKNQIIVRTKLKTELGNERINSGDINNTHVISGNFLKQGNKKFIINSTLNGESMKHSSSSYELKQGKGNSFSMKKEEIYTYEHKDNGNLNNENQ